MPEQPAPQLHPIPDLFHSYDTGAPFTHCKVCEKELIESGTLYGIEKVIRMYPDYATKDVIFEYAICINCQQVLDNDLSEDSKERIQEYFQEHSDFSNRVEKIKKGEPLDLHQWLDHCVIKSTPVSQMKEYQVAAMCIGDQMLVAEFPYLLSGEAMHELSMLLSNQTLGEMGGFIDKYLGPPPELRELFEQRKYVLT